MGKFKFYKTTWLNELRQVILDEKLKIKDFDFSEGEFQGGEIPSLTVVYLPNKDFDFGATYNRGEKRVECKYSPGPLSLTAHKQNIPSNPFEFKSIKVIFSFWIEFLAQEVLAEELRNVETPLSEKDLNRIRDNKVYEVLVEEESPNDRDEIISVEQRETVKQIFPLLLNYAQGEIGKQITQEQFESLVKKVDELSKKMDEPKLTKNIVFGILGRLTEHEVFQIIGPYFKEFVLKPIWEGLKGFLPW